MMQRQLILLSGEHNAMLQSAYRHLHSTPSVLWVTTVESTSAIFPAADSASDPVWIPAGKARTILGQTFHAVVFDAWSGLDINALAMVAGTIRAGGALILLTPELELWPNYPDPDYQRFLAYPWQPDQLPGHFLRRFVRLLHAAPLATLAHWPPPVLTDFTLQASVDQQLGLQQILATAQTVVLSADRGRGKSALLGMVAQALVQQGQQVLLTAPGKAAASSVFQHAGAAQLPFLGPDELLRQQPLADVLLVDEAAAIPLPLLVALLQQYPRCIFATTLHGYEGSGRGFVLRFQALLDQYAPDWQAVRLETPIRWQPDDPLEQWLHDTLLLNAELPALGVAGETATDDLMHRCVSAERLSQDENLLREVFALLVQAHYQTRPSDLRQLLDSPTLSLHVLCRGQQVLAVALLSREGGLPVELAEVVRAGQRRLHGHLMPQSLVFHAGLASAMSLRCERIMRIAVHPEYQQQGGGQYFVAQLRAYARHQQADYLAVSYAVSVPLLRFWQQAGFRSVRLGYRKDTASGERSLLQMVGLSAEGAALCREATARFQQQLPDWLEKLGDVPPELAAQLRDECA